MVRTVTRRREQAPALRCGNAANHGEAVYGIAAPSSMASLRGQGKRLLGLAHSPSVSRSLDSSLSEGALEGGGIKPPALRCGNAANHGEAVYGIAQSAYGIPTPSGMASPRARCMESCRRHKSRQRRVWHRAKRVWNPDAVGYGITACAVYGIATGASVLPNKRTHPFG